MLIPSRGACQVFVVLLMLLVWAPNSSSAQTHNFDRDPEWEGFRNRLVPTPARKTRQDFGYTPSRHAGGERAGEIGGWINRSLTPASYSKAIAPKTLDDKLTASGRFAVYKDHGGTGTLFGWFNQNSRGWRTPNSIGFRIDGNGGKYWVLFEYATSQWRSGSGSTFEGKYQTTKTKPFLADGTSHAWTLTYDPAGNDNAGELIFVFDGVTYRAPLAPGHKADGATFDRFGIWNQQISGDGMEAYFDDVSLDGERQDFDNDPNWIGVGNRITFADRGIRPLQDFGYSATQHAGGQLGEIGGLVWRDERPSYYAAKTEPLSLETPLHAAGKLAFCGAGSDSAVCIGWFDSAAKQNKATPEHKEPQPHQLGILLEGPSRIGHYFRPIYRDATGAGEASPSGPILKPDSRVHAWSLDYDPRAAAGRGRITVKLDDREQSLDLRPGERQAGASFDRFGLYDVQSGGHHIELYLDDLSFTSVKP